MRSALRQTRRIAHHDYTALHSTVPAFLCPALSRTSIVPTLRHSVSITSSKTFSTSRRIHLEATATIPPDTSSESPVPEDEHLTPPLFKGTLPRTCPGCGAPTQIYDKDEAGYYNIHKNSIKKYLSFDPAQKEVAKAEDDLYTKALKQVDPKLLQEIGMEPEVIEAGDPVEESGKPSTPVCERCHNLVHHHVGVPIFHPSIEAIQQTISESPHRRNHIYHVIDAADFPLSLIPTLQSSLRIPKLRTQNRRARHKGWVANDRIAEVSFIITRADLLAPKKEQVDALMPYMRDVLRDALGRTNKLARLGNIRLVSAKRGWWTKQVKEDIWSRGGAGWMVGKVNVGKSNLFEVVFPKGRGADYQDIRKIRSEAERTAMLDAAESPEELTKIQEQLAEEDEEVERHNQLTKENTSDAFKSPDGKTNKQEEVGKEEEEEDFDPDALLPPAQPYTPYPVLPIAHSLPGTTASPIRIPFGNNRGELVDLPGLARTNPGLETFVQPDSHSDLVMTSRINAERFALKPGQSLILGGGLIRITPTTPDLVFLIHPFVPIEPHVTRTEKAVDLQAQTSDRKVPTILTPGIGEQMRSAGTFKLKWDVTKKLAGPLTSAVAAKMRPENLPFRIFSTDILIEGVGWLEISAQIRRPQGWRAPGMIKKDPNQAAKAKALAQQRAEEQRANKYVAKMRGEELPEENDMRDDATHDDEVDEETAQGVIEFPEIEVFSPLGKFVGARRPMCASTVGGPKYVASRDRSARPRRSMVSVKRQRKPAAMA